MRIITNQTFDEERALYGERDIIVRSCKFDGPADGESAFKECANITAEDCFFNLRYPFWHDKNLKISGSEMTELCRAALWYSHDVEITDTRLLCYCKGLKLVNCEMIDTDLSFEKSEVEACITTPILSVKNPLSGKICAPDVGEIIRDDENSHGEVIICGECCCA